MAGIVAIEIESKRLKRAKNSKKKKTDFEIETRKFYLY